MSDETTRSRRPAGHGGLLDNLLALMSALVGFFESRAALVAKESRTALIRCLIVAVCLLGGLMLFAFGYIFLVTSVIVAIAQAAQISWVWTALGAAGVHFLIALIFLFIARSKTTKPMFRATSAELKKDAEWLRNLNITSHRRN